MDEEEEDNEVQLSMVVFRRWLDRIDRTDPAMRSFLTIGLFLADHSVMNRIVVPADRHLIDQDLLLSFLDCATPSEAECLIGLSPLLFNYLSVDSFRHLYDWLINASDDLDYLSLVLNTSGDFLDQHPGAFQLPKDLAESLLSSSDGEFRIRGFRAYRHTSATDTEIVSAVTRLLQLGGFDDTWVALSGIDRVVSVRGIDCFRNAAQEELQALLEALQMTADTHEDPHARKSAASHIIRITGVP
ncbi:hypothetical protein [Blastopirellula marina]|uniref:HEAT repeat domain-containing protein n=1 Tax=Blastopirellula marina TaxID=124 RepID=A0A2S8GBU4_9BACT|nr:hypothetical protein [Blastopirellula marina]PQO41928.1 hypothetical protein C5Y98_02505 [Blastopirellula marina]PTL46286.1 hypothetical protein C5Y97_02505 [Blastopirellula marina]